VKTRDDVFEAIADAAAQAASYEARADLMREISASIRRRGLTPAEAAFHSGVPVARIADLQRGRVTRFSVVALQGIAAALEQ
jgi:predicted XRE-type DNA-binding protein